MQERLLIIYILDHASATLKTIWEWTRAPFFSFNILVVTHGSRRGRHDDALSSFWVHIKQLLLFIWSHVNREREPIGATSANITVRLGPCCRSARSTRRKCFESCHGCDHEARRVSVWLILCVSHHHVILERFRVVLRWSFKWRLVTQRLLLSTWELKF